ncbi:uncharacterized protein B0H18DRAFT_113011 [Fomitopsis serialis]|uniref:uncharacterized protein n=1 Tax=Fomitopsis serialis TaxID=139415 RepID=UPI002008E213|nr:uncharacterized protein B0H18DRAFT_113011 [Neoantrodia serialis]KAH9914963.1 hypothetical protein B0H18DRAFT_113011 [Neoantrodia serialis]
MTGATNVLQGGGHSITAPDMLGYGGTDKPAETALYKHSAMCADVRGRENVSKAIVIEPLGRTSRTLTRALLRIRICPGRLHTIVRELQICDCHGHGQVEAIGYEPYDYWQ